MVNQVTTANNMAKPSNGPDLQRQALNTPTAENQKGNPEANRIANKSLLAHMGDTASDLTNNVTKTAINQSTDAARKGAKMAMEGMLHATFLPVTMMIHTLDKSTNGMAGIAIATISKWLSPRLDSHFEKLGLKFPMPTDQIIKNLLMGNYDELSTEVTEALTNYVEKSMPQNVQAALASGNPMQIASATGMSMMGGVKDVMGGIKKEQGKGWLVTAPFKWLGKNIPYLNKLPPVAQPWVAGGIIFYLGKKIFHGVKKLAKLAAGGALLATAIGFGKKILAGGMKAGGSQGGIGNLMGAVSGIAGGGKPGAAGKAGGMMDAINMGSQLLGGFSKLKK